MQEIPPAKDTDAEDVVWGLQTAETLWKRGERIDALVWLRRAAQAAGDANDDDRALELARHAAELTEWMASATDDEDQIEEIEPDVDPDDLEPVPRGPWDSGVPPPSPPWDVAAAAAAAQQPLQRSNTPRMFPSAPPQAAPPPPPPAPQTAPLPQTEPEQTEHTEQVDEVEAAARRYDEQVQRQRREREQQQQAQQAPPLPQVQDEEEQEQEHTQAQERQPEHQPDEDEGRPSATSVPPAEKVHAGMFDPWADQSAQMQKPAEQTPAPPPAPAPPPPPVPKRPSPSRVGSQPAAPAATDEVEEEVVTSVRPQAGSSRSDAPPMSSVPISSPSPPMVAPPPRPSRPSLSQTGERPQTPATAIATPVAAPPPPSPKPPPLPPRRAAAPPAPPAPPAKPAPTPPTPPRAPAPADPDVPKPLDLENVEAFADLPDDARTEFAAAATLHPLAEGEEIGTFALAYVVEGEFDVSATMVDAPAMRLSDGAVLRSRGTTTEGVPMRLICAKGTGIVATWSDAAVKEAFRTCPWVEEDLRAAADRVQTIVGITIGPLGERLDVSIRELILARLTMRPLIAKEIVVNMGEAVPGLLLVGIGELELVNDDKVSGHVSSGEFLFPTEVLGGGSAPSTARAGPGGALVMFGDRRIAQELLVTCPPLLEVFAGM